MKTSTTTTDASSKDRQSIQGIEDDDGGGSGLQRRRSVDFTFYCVANSNTVSSLSYRCLVSVLFSSDSFFFLFTARKTISTATMWKIFLYQV